MRNPRCPPPPYFSPNHGPIELQDLLYGPPAYSRSMLQQRSTPMLRCARTICLPACVSAAALPYNARTLIRPPGAISMHSRPHYPSM
jgi:hypothetical protein